MLKVFVIVSRSCLKMAQTLMLGASYRDSHDKSSSLRLEYTHKLNLSSRKEPVSSNFTKIASEVKLIKYCYPT